MSVRTEFPRATKVWRDVFIPLSDGVRLAAQIWLPVDAAENPVPAILEYLPYRKRDGTVERDALTHPYYAGFGYAGVRVDIRGTGDSDGILHDEYSKQEQDDALEVIAWLARQPWCTGAVGMIGISWGGFNGLQVAARRPKALRAVVSLCSTDDRYADDIHAMGGALLVDKAGWGSAMFSILTTPPDPALVGDRWRGMWIDRMDDHALWLLHWHEHQRRGDFHRHGSVREDYRAIKCPVYLVGGWADGYSNPIFRLLKGLKVPRKALIGPWAHKYPHFGVPGPAIGFLQETLRWWDKWLKGIETGVMDGPMLRAYMQDPAPPRRQYETRAGRFVAEDTWPSKRITARRLKLSPHVLGGKASAAVLAISSPQTTGEAAGEWCPYGSDPDQADDQRIDAGGSLVFDSAPLEGAFEILGSPVAEIAVSVDRPVAILAVTLSDVQPDGAATRISYAILNLTHRDGHDSPSPAVPGEVYRLKVRLNEVAQRFETGHRIRLAVSTSYWPIVWPAPERVTLSVHLAGSRLVLPERPPRDEDASLPPFEPAETAAPLVARELRAPQSRWTIDRDLATGVLHNRIHADDGEMRLEEIDWKVGSSFHRELSIHPDDPLSARFHVEGERRFGRGDLNLRITTAVKMHATPTTFEIKGRLEAFENEKSVHKRDWQRSIKRDLV